MPTVVGEMMPFRSGYACIRPCVCWNDFWSASSPYATFTSFMSLYFGSFNSSCMKPIQVFWLVAFWVAERIAIFPLWPICSPRCWTRLRPICSELAWLMKS